MRWKGLGHSYSVFLPIYHLGSRHRVLTASSEPWGSGLLVLLGRGGYLGKSLFISYSLCALFKFSIPASSLSRPAVRSNGTTFVKILVLMVFPWTTGSPAGILLLCRTNI